MQPYPQSHAIITWHGFPLSCIDCLYKNACNRKCQVQHQHMCKFPSRVTVQTHLHITHFFTVQICDTIPFSPHKFAIAFIFHQHSSLRHPSQYDTLPVAVGSSSQSLQFFQVLLPVDSIHQCQAHPATELVGEGTRPISAAVQVQGSCCKRKLISTLKHVS